MNRYYWPDAGRYITPDPVNLGSIQNNSLWSRRIVEEIRITGVFDTEGMSNILYGFNPRFLFSLPFQGGLSDNDIIELIIDELLINPELFNLFPYVGNNPITRIDPRGLFVYTLFKKVMEVCLKLEPKQCSLIALPFVAMPAIGNPNATTGAFIKVCRDKCTDVCNISLYLGTYSPHGPWL